MSVIDSKSYPGVPTFTMVPRKNSETVGTSVFTIIRAVLTHEIDEILAIFLLRFIVQTISVTAVSAP